MRKYFDSLRDHKEKLEEKERRNKSSRERILQSLYLAHKGKMLNALNSLMNNKRQGELEKDKEIKLKKALLNNLSKNNSAKLRQMLNKLANYNQDMMRLNGAKQGKVQSLIN